MNNTHVPARCICKPSLSPWPIALQVQNHITLQGHALKVAAENSDLKIELLRWRKKASILCLKLASADEDYRWLLGHQDLAARESALRHQHLETVQQDRTVLQTDCQKQEVGGRDGGTMVHSAARYKHSSRQINPAAS